MHFLSRRQIDDAAWNRCVAGAHNALMYGHTWYLDAVTSLPGWRWEGLADFDGAADGRAPAYRAVLPVPLRRRWGQWVVYQPLFCQFLALFSEQPIDPDPFVRAVLTRYRHCAKWHLLLAHLLSGLPDSVQQRIAHTHILALTASEAENSTKTEPVTFPDAYTADRRMNLRRAIRRIGELTDWQITESTDVEPLLTLFRENHAEAIGVGEWAYGLLRRLFTQLQQRGLATLHYTWANGAVVAGALFVAQHRRIIYLFNAANDEGRRLNARSVLIDVLIRQEQKKSAGLGGANGPILDFESPEKPGVVSFYESFGATPQPYVVLAWSRLTRLERLGRWVKNRLLR